MLDRLSFFRFSRITIVRPFLPFVATSYDHVFVSTSGRHVFLSECPALRLQILQVLGHAFLHIRSKGGGGGKMPEGRGTCEARSNAYTSAHNLSTVTFLVCVPSNTTTTSFSTTTANSDTTPSAEPCLPKIFRNTFTAATGCPRTGSPPCWKGYRPTGSFGNRGITPKMQVFFAT